MNSFITKEEIDKYKELDEKIRSHARKVLVKWYDILKKNNYIRFIEPIYEDEIIFISIIFHQKTKLMDMGIIPLVNLLPTIV